MIREWKFAIGLVAGFLVGMSGVFAMAHQEITTTDLFEAYQKGFKEALNAERPSEKLEAVCAALWFKGNENAGRTNP
jgi:hypothetical protein